PGPPAARGLAGPVPPGGGRPPAGPPAAGTAGRARERHGVPVPVRDPDARPHDGGRRGPQRGEHHPRPDRRDFRPRGARMNSPVAVLFESHRPGTPAASIADAADVPLPYPQASLAPEPAGPP